MYGQGNGNLQTVEESAGKSLSFPAKSSIGLPKAISPEQAASLVKSGDLILTPHSSASPRAFVKALVARADELSGVTISHVRVETPTEYLESHYSGSFFHNAFMIGPRSRKAMQEGRADFVPNCYGKIPMMLRRGILKPDIAVLQLSPPDKYGFCSYGICTSYLPVSVEVARIVVGEINDQVPTTCGSRLHISDLHYIVDASYPLHEVPQPAITDVEAKIGANVAELIKDGDTLQIGIGAIPDAILAGLKGHRDLGVHTEMFSDGLVEMVEKGIITGRKKKLHRNKIITTFVMGTNYLYKYLHQNSIVEFFPVEYTNDPSVIAQNENLVAVNSALEVDITGQINAESIGPRMFTGTGGQLDFAMGAQLASNGRFIVAMPATAGDGKYSRITAMLKPGSTVTTPRSLADTIVTEYGVAELRGKNLRQRAKALIKIAHPNFREQIERDALERNDVCLR